jgi:hypothetical protein
VAIEALIKLNEYVFGEVKLPTEVAHPVNSLTLIKYAPDNGEYEIGILAIIN